MLEGFPLVSRFTIPFSDVDMMQHVNNVAYIRWCEMLRVEHFARAIAEPINGPRGIIQANIMFTYERELRYREEIAIGVRVSRMGTKSYDYSYEMWSLTQGQRSAHGITTVVAFNFIERHSIEIPPEWRTAIDAFEAGPQQTFQ
jgi:acyl-CoA thioester hydrolase